VLTLRLNTRPCAYRGLKIFTSLPLRFQDFQRLMGYNSRLSPTVIAHPNKKTAFQFEIENQNPLTYSTLNNLIPRSI
ncbi:MAG: hypothetical protein ABL903_17240, partial [Methylococcales bacterium]